MILVNSVCPWSTKLPFFLSKHWYSTCIMHSVVYVLLTWQGWRVPSIMRSKCKFYVTSKNTEKNIRCAKIFAWFSLWYTELIHFLMYIRFSWTYALRRDERSVICIIIQSATSYVRNEIFYFVYLVKQFTINVSESRTSTFKFVIDNSN